MSNYFLPPKDNPVEQLRKSLPKGNANWPSFNSVYTRLQQAACHLSKQRYKWLSDDHLYTMAVMGTCNEELMKGWLLNCIQYGWC
jgi:hypothetical protein